MNTIIVATIIIFEIKNSQNNLYTLVNPLSEPYSIWHLCYLLYLQCSIFKKVNLVSSLVLDILDLTFSRREANWLWPGPKLDNSSKLRDKRLYSNQQFWESEGDLTEWYLCSNIKNIKRFLKIRKIRKTCAQIICSDLVQIYIVQINLWGFGFRQSDNRLTL